VPAKRLSMRKIREILRLVQGEGMPRRAVAQSVGVSPTTVSGCIRRAEEASLDWPLKEDLDDSALESLLYPPPAHSSRSRAEPASVIG